MNECPNSQFLSFSNTNELDILFRVYTNLIDMLKNRNYIIQEEDNKATDFETFQSLFEEQDNLDISLLQFIVEKPFDTSKLTITEKEEKEKEELEKVAIFWTDVEKIGVKQIKSYIDFMDENEVNHSIIIMKYSITTTAAKLLDDFNLNMPDKYLEYFEYSDLLINITKHVLVPKYILLNQAEKDDLLKRYQLRKEAQLPKLLRTDSISRYYGLKKGDVVKIIRESNTQTQYVNYRIVI